MTVRVFVCLCCCLLVAACGSRSESSGQNVATPGAASTPQQAGTSQTLTPAADSSVGVEDASGGRPDATATTADKKIDPCALLTAADIKEVRGETVSKQTPSERVSDAFLVAQCYYAMPTLSNSINLALKREAPNNAGKGAIKNFWQRFREAKPNKKSEAPEPVSGVGDEAYWEGSSRFGVLHVLRGDSYILSISIGGKDEPEEKRKKSIALAAKALKRLPS